MKNVYFSDDELKCKCGCNILNVKPVSLSMLNQARMYASIPFILTSACRCPEHNKNEGGSITSSHIATKTTECSAFDIRTHNSTSRLMILTGLIKAGFNRIGVAKDFIHVDTDLSKPSGVMWLYK